MANDILVVAAHPDDEVIGCGGTIARLSAAGKNCHLLVMAEGVTSRDDARDPDSRKNELSGIKKACLAAAKVLGIKSVEFKSNPDNRLDSLARLDLVKQIEKKIRGVKPEVVYTHHHGDLNIDHRIVAEAVLVACRPIPGCLVKEIYAFEILSSTEWSFAEKNTSFHPNCFVDIKNTLARKLKAMKKYASELRDFPHPRSLEALDYLAKIRGAQVGLPAAEAFTLIRKID